MQERDTTDFNKIDIIKPTTMQLCMRTHGECIYCQFNAPHPSATLSDWSSEDWDGNKARAREQCPLLDFKILEKQIQEMLQDRAQDITQDTTHDVTTDKQETDLVNSIQDLMLEPKSDAQNLTYILAPPLDMPEVKSKGEDGYNSTRSRSRWGINYVKIRHWHWWHWWHWCMRRQTRRSDYRKRKKSMGSICAPSVMKGMILT